MSETTERLKKSTLSTIEESIAHAVVKEAVDTSLIFAENNDALNRILFRVSELIAGYVHDRMLGLTKDSSPVSPVKKDLPMGFGL